jgi:hypothetical protein
MSYGVYAKLLVKTKNTKSCSGSCLILAIKIFYCPRFNISFIHHGADAEIDAGTR